MFKKLWNSSLASVNCAVYKTFPIPISQWNESLRWNLIQPKQYIFKSEALKEIPERISICVFRQSSRECNKGEISYTSACSGQKTPITDRIRYEKVASLEPRGEEAKMHLIAMCDTYTHTDSIMSGRIA